MVVERGCWVFFLLSTLMMRFLRRMLSIVHKTMSATMITKKSRYSDKKMFVTVNANEKETMMANALRGRMPITMSL